MLTKIVTYHFKGKDGLWLSVQEKAGVINPYWPVEWQFFIRNIIESKRLDRQERKEKLKRELMEAIPIYIILIFLILMFVIGIP